MFASLRIPGALRAFLPALLGRSALATLDPEADAPEPPADITSGILAAGVAGNSRSKSRSTPPSG